MTTRAEQTTRPSKHVALLLLAPALLILCLDLTLRSEALLRFHFFAKNATSLLDRLRGAHALAYLSSLCASALLWGSLLSLTRATSKALRRSAIALFLALFPACLAVQTAFRLRYNFYLSRDATELSDAFLRAALGSLRLEPRFLLIYAAWLCVAVLLVVLSRKTSIASKRRERVSAVVFAIAFVYAAFMPVSYRQYQATTPDLLWMNAVSIRARVDRSTAEASMQMRSPEPMPKLEAKPARPRNVVLILQESVRADVVCVEPTAHCDKATQATNELLPKRFPFVSARSNASATAIAMSVLFTGLDPTAPKERLLRWPTLFEIADAAGYDTAYFSSQHLIFANLWLWVADIPSQKMLFATHLDTQADMFTGAPDELLAERLKSEIDKLREPFFLVLHPSNVHTPRTGDRIQGPFVPANEDKSDKHAYVNAYRNAVHRSDLAVASMIRSLRAAPFGARTVVVYTSDHGESVWEHGQGCDHGCSVFEEEIRVPLWIDAPSEALSQDEQEALRAFKEEPVFHVDVAATLLDLMGVWDADAMRARRALLLGHPLTRKPASPNALRERILPLSNVSYGWERGLPSYGLMRGDEKLSAMHRHERYLCFDLKQDPAEQHDLDAGCAALRARAEEVYQGPPSGFDKLMTSTRFGPFVR